MRFFLFILVLGLSFNSCNEKAKREPEKDGLVMYNPSEMALLMEKMYQENMDLKERIAKEEPLGHFSEEFNNIHTAVLTDAKDRNDGFESFSKAFISNQKAIFKASVNETKIKFNTMVATCVACHETTCTGPIPKIKKLLIN